MKTMNLCRPLERSRGNRVTECVETMLKKPSTSLRSRMKDVVQAARQEERQKLLLGFLRERKSWEAARREERNKIIRLQEELKKKDSSISLLKAALDKKETRLTQLKRDVQELERHLEDHMTSRVHNSRTMKKLVGRAPALYQGLLRFGNLPVGMDPFHEVAMNLLQEDKLNEQAKLNQEEDRTECSSEANTVDIHMEEEESDFKTIAESFIRS
ncbi:hypothetical protein AAMO2058_000525100 [Amorphochlora amoebiformis]|uniref:Uncharacterized protein n=1 Tax=Amorphochlora amoebiformis TaxID=1561963 RepID=A0A7S0H7I3_9EUKA|mmetsp:Transcript_3562/g.5476  ORF Transcript_3562/g.5476 Transcript_3562/m.5476 type:complete len:214 (+) Transcript_3562:132-773(+)